MNVRHGQIDRRRLRIKDGLIRMFDVEDGQARHCYHSRLLEYSEPETCHPLPDHPGVIHLPVWSEDDAGQICIRVTDRFSGPAAHR